MFLLCYILICLKLTILIFILLFSFQTNIHIPYQIKDKAGWDAAMEDLKNNAPGSDAPSVPDPSTAVETTGK